MKQLFLLVIVLFSTLSCSQKEIQLKHTNEMSFKMLSLGEVKPTGWIAKQMQRDLTDGFAGRLDELTKRAGDSVFLKHRDLDWDGGDWKRDPRLKDYPDMFRWWDGESEGNWRIGLVEMAYLSDEPVAIRKIAGYLDAVVQKSYQENGYIGMFGPTLRYRTIGDLWSQSLILKSLLSYYHLTGKEEVLKAVILAVDQMIAAYNVFGVHKNIYDTNRNGHSLASYTDVADQLYKITNDPKYVELVNVLYQDFSSSKMIEGSKESARESVDMQLQNLLDMNKPFKEHAVHIVEQMRAPIFLHRHLPDSIRYKWAFDNSMRKLQHCISPSGNCIGDEWVMERAGSPTIGHEYCVMTELVATYAAAIEATAQVNLGNDIETLVFNAAQSARLANGKAISYITTDNRLEAKANGHYMSPTHEERAVCCNPNAVRLMPLYVQNMWMRFFEGKEEGLACLLYGPSIVSTAIKDVHVMIEQSTLYPIEECISFKVHVEKAAKFPLCFRIPEWADDMLIQTEGGVIERRDNQTAIVTKMWQKEDQLRITFSSAIKQHKASNGEFYFSKGSLVYALPIQHKTETSRLYPSADFTDEIYEPTNLDKEKWDYWVDEPMASNLTPVQNKTNTDYIWDTPQLGLTGSFKDKQGNQKPIELVPLGNTILRRVSFPHYK